MVDTVLLDRGHIENSSPIKDLVIIAKTVMTVLSGDGAYQIQRRRLA